MQNGFVFLFLLLIAATVQAEVWEVPANLTFHEAPVELTFKAKNDSADAQPVSALITVVDYRIISKPQFLNAGDAGEIKLKLLPRNDLVGSTYTSILTVNVGEKEMRREIKLTFAKAGEAKPAPNGGQKREAEGAAVAFAVLPSAALNEATLNIVLAVFAPILLISFIARFTKRVVQK